MLPNDVIFSPADLRRAREAIGLTTAEAAQYVHVTRRTWEMWESGTRPVPPAKSELFFRKIEGVAPSVRDLVVVVAEDLSPIDVIAEDTFLSLSEVGDGTAVISSMAIDRVTGRPYVHRTRFKTEPHNKHVLRKTSQWRSALQL